MENASLSYFFHIGLGYGSLSFPIEPRLCRPSAFCVESLRQSGQPEIRPIREGL